MTLQVASGRDAAARICMLALSAVQQHVVVSASLGDMIGHGDRIFA